MLADIDSLASHLAPSNWESAPCTLFASGLSTLSARRIGKHQILRYNDTEWNCTCACMRMSEFKSNLMAVTCADCAWTLSRSPGYIFVGIYMVKDADTMVQSCHGPQWRGCSTIQLA